MSTSGTPRAAGQRPTGSKPAQGTGRGTQQRTPAQPAQKPAQRPQNARPASQAQGRPAQRPAQPGLVRPAPKAKVRKARLLVSKIDPWSVLKMAFLLSVALGIVTVVGAVVLWTVMDLTGIFDQVNDLLAQVLGSEGGNFTVQQLVSLGQVASFATIIAVVNVVLLTALSMLGAVLYNISSTLVGGIGVTLTDD
ncbi:DUF3566 domain-containing protein [Citricoccus sp.]|uniref:DUF3566 domain-containing protein n=1 Tax=Citricoccus sp. TaxID=1978372 RepID=UPI00262DD434|nr:DUF3566 domain-containing protein [Citricoccus sp.]HRO30384.1 DUF3566 domain-containing protein [Citricoccus sp.]HRO92450.1 DUF3566 domain-containing protein [Citricoccus sp.]